VPSLDQLLAPPVREQDAPLVEGELVLQGGARYARINGDRALWGPLEGAAAATEGDTVLVAVSQLGTYWVIAHG
jgi:hypothetical protein